MVDQGESSNAGVSPAQKSKPQTLDRALRLFEFLRGLQLQKTRPIRTLQQYQDQGGKVLWFHSMPLHSAIASAHRIAEPAPDEPFLVVDRVARLDPPQPNVELRPWVDLDRARDPAVEPTLRSEIVIPSVDDEGNPATTVRQLDHYPDLLDQFSEWLLLWRAWAAVELQNKPVRDLYAHLFSMSEQVVAAPEEMEAVIALGHLSWRPESHEEVQRHILVIPVQLTFDDRTGRMTVAWTEEGVSSLKIELDMLDPVLRLGKERLDEITSSLAIFEAHLFNMDAIQVPLTRLVNNLDSGGRYLPHEQPVEASSDATVTFAPALIVRKRSTQSLLRIFEEIRSQLEETGQVPEGLVPLVEVAEGSDLRLGGEEESMDGGAEEFAGRMYLPLPANDEQHQIVERVSTRRHTVVQGPPGTGKTHTIANLLAHLLAQGLRVLITAHTDRALRELKAKLPADLSALCVSAVGQARTDLADLKVAVNTIASRAAEYNAVREEQQILRLEMLLSELKEERAKAQSEMVEVRQQETQVWAKGSYEGTLAQIAVQHGGEASRHSWLSHFSPDLSVDPPITDEEAKRALMLIRDKELADHEEVARQEMVEMALLPAPEEFQEWTDLQAQAEATAAAYAEARHHPSYVAISSLDSTTRLELQKRLSGLTRIASRLAARGEQWMSAALADVLSGRPELWTRRHSSITRLLADARPIVQRLGSTPEVQITSTSTAIEALIAQARELLAHLRAGGKLTGLIKPKAVKNAAQLLATVRVQGLPPNDAQRLEAFIDWTVASKKLREAEQLWPTGMEIPTEDTLEERLGWNEDEIRQLGQVLQLGSDLHEEEERLDGLEVPKPDWSQLEAVAAYGELVEAVSAHESAVAARKPLENLQNLLNRAANKTGASSTMADLRDAVVGSDPASYRTGFGTVSRLHELRLRADQRDELMERLSTRCPSLVDALIAEPEDEHWLSRMSTLSAAWEWCRVGEWIDEIAARSIDLLQAQMKASEERIQETVASLTAAKAWAWAVERLGAREQQSLKSYALAVRQLGKGTGRYAVHRRAQAQGALAECRSAVPAWIMPIYRVADTLKVDSDVFDVVIIDEASQASVEACFLQYLAPRLVVVGDDKQVSPQAVGLERQQLIDLGRQLIDDLPHSFTWTNPETSFFDQARLRYGDVITLREHFRCVPEIIGFSNRIAYEPDNVPLIPLRQYGLDRLDPIKTVHVTGGYQEGRTGNTVNPPEADELIETLLKCCGDPAYDDKTMGVISLTGRAQADRIERELLQRLDPREIRARELRCGDAAAFQGSERDVMFLSMVAARREGSPLAALTREGFVQRFNVAGSRAKDQMWVFHSVSLGDLHNRDDMRYQLLDYCYATQKRGSEVAAQTALVPEDVQVSPFESLFEQHVFNRVVERGFTVIPQWEVRGYRIDLVVVGGHSRLAIECDGDRWHGPERYEQDLGRQRELERCGWSFKRIRASEFYRDAHRALEPLWELLVSHDIRPAHFVSEEPSLESSDPERVFPEDEGPGEAPRIQSVEEMQAGEEVEEADDSAHSGTDPDWKVLNEPTPRPISSPVSSPPPAVPQPESRPNLAPSIPLVGTVRELQPYSAWNPATRVASPDHVQPRERMEVLRQIVEMEGPILGRRLYQLYVRSAGMSRVGKHLAKLLNIASHAAASQGLLIESNPLDEPGQQVKTFRLGSQPEVSLRELGPRTIWEVPPAELAAALDYARGGLSLPTEDWYRRLLDLYGLQRLTEPTKQRLDACRSLL